MIGILNRWRQFGRRYFWPHLLLGMVAASFGLPQASAHDRITLAETSSRSLNIGSATRIDRLVMQQDGVRRSSFSVDYWHQHAIRTVIRHLSFSLTPSVSPVAAAAPLEAHKLALLETLNTLLTREARPPVIIRHTTRRPITVSTHHHIGLWLAQVCGIRAGPSTRLR
ncbi:secA translation cis-regulator SecM [Erwinia amylovora]|uniref:Secretion monitor n=4 Tax=Erwinia amylovora TaxID=552 RepID=A0A831A0Q2_ERWAM|nr:secA translation cis-regulator SecM [Erwinia amylovora]CBX81768.1 Secretion monitor precursor [Erwinia amylovora ATCC BAA-2158]CDK16253.1 Secretion monitor precursor [Erwinia amylovora LA635]CDK19619.1 Secretion monitor precursor [Erwinia amylovora LA636]CDK22991.1 Secretion monitor precursor [Erwinia amylovora LA637]ATZ10620.1 secA regulator SecM [Erwinia amylovora]